MRGDPLRDPPRRRRFGTFAGVARPRRPRPPIVPVLLVALIALAPGAQSDEERDADGPPRDAPACLARFERAWRARDAAAIVRCMAEGGHLRVRLFERPFRRDETYTMLADRAATSLDQYFVQIERVDLVEHRVEDEKETRESPPPERPPLSVRTYDYAYRVKGKSAASNRLQVRVVEVEGGSWALDSVIELPGRDAQDPDGR